MTRKDLPKGFATLAYGAQEEANFEAMAAEIGYERKTTFYSDLSIAECYGVKGIRETFDSVMENWTHDVVYFTEFVLSLNWKSWCWSSRNDAEFTKLYIDLYYQANDYAYGHFTGDDLAYFIRTTD